VKLTFFLRFERRARPVGPDEVNLVQKLSVLKLFKSLSRRRITVTVTAMALALLAVIGFNLVAVRGTFAGSEPIEDAGGEALVLGAPDHRIAGRVYLNGEPRSHAPLVVVLHGDAPFLNPGYQYSFAYRLAKRVPGIRVVGLLRPGYADPYGGKSDGDRGFASGENYTASVTRDVADAIESLKQQWSPAAVFLIGHSGGAAVAANVAALRPGLVQHAFLVGCPCDISPFRKHMARMQWSPVWLLPAQSLSPLDTVSGMSPITEVTAISGVNDPLTLPEYAQRYVAKAKSLGIAASLVMIPDKGHEILLDPKVIEMVETTVKDWR
jgi:alpha-beta hydrolase superfamily lysophospholipase